MPRKTGENTVKHRDGGVGSVVANHRGGGKSSVVVTTVVLIILNSQIIISLCYFLGDIPNRSKKNVF